MDVYSPGHEVKYGKFIIFIGNVTH
jgi:hypothetical protein